AESSVARQSAIGQGVPPQDILVEKTSHTTYENLFFARQVAQAEGLKQVLIVSDPLHMKRAVSIAVDLGFEANPSPTPTSKYQSAKTQLRSLAHETYYYIGYLMRRPFMTSSSIEPRRAYATRIAARLPDKWLLEDSDDQLLLSRKEPISVYGCVGMDLNLLRHPEL